MLKIFEICSYELYSTNTHLNKYNFNIILLNFNFVFVCEIFIDMVPSENTCERACQKIRTNSSDAGKTMNFVLKCMKNLYIFGQIMNSV